MDIENIKWLIGYADEFEWNGNDFILCFKAPNGYSYTIDELGHHTESIIWPLLLQKAIEGINNDFSADSKYYIEQHVNAVLVLNIADGSLATVFILDEDTLTMVECKEQALDYIYIKEMKK